MFSSWKMTIVWLLFVAIGGGARIFLGKGSRIAVWIPGDRHPLDRQASAIRWTLVAIAALMIWQGWRLTMNAASDVLFVVVGSALLVVFLWIPDAAFHLSSGVNRILRKAAGPQSS